MSGPQNLQYTHSFEERLANSDERGLTSLIDGPFRSETHWEPRLYNDSRLNTVAIRSTAKRVCSVYRASVRAFRVRISFVLCLCIT